MKIVNKFSIELMPICNQFEIIGLAAETLNVDILKFNDGSIRVTIPALNNNRYIKHGLCEISAYVESLDDLMVIAQIKDIIERKSLGQVLFNLELLGTAYTRYDRVMFEDKIDGFGAKVFADFVNSIGFNSVTLYDPHSEVISYLIKNTTVVKQQHLLNHLISNEKFGIICPDKGAKKKVDSTNMPTVYCDKSRNPETGKINGIIVSSISVGKIDRYDKLIVVDDICEGGGTFLGLADSLTMYDCFSEKEICLYVTHGIFSNNAIEKLLEKYSKIYVYFLKESVYNSLTEQQRLNVVYSTLIRD